jgi:fructokinase
MNWFGSVELGGSNCRSAIGDGSRVVQVQGRFETGDDPVSIVGRLARWFHQQGRELEAVGVASFGPLDVVDGTITVTPKHGWQGFPLRSELAKVLHVPVVLDTDVNGAVLAEWTWGAAQGLHDVLHVSVGTGIGVGAIVAGRVVHGSYHPEMGHMRIPPREGDRWPGACDFHGSCWEGLASGHAMSARHGVEAAQIDDDAAWDLEAEYLAKGIANLICLYRPQRVIVGGGVLRHEGLLEAIRPKVADLLDRRYFPEAAHLAELISAPGLAGDSGLLGGILLARRGARRNIGVIGPGSHLTAGLDRDSFDALCGKANEVGRRIAERRGVVVTGGLGGVMEAASQGAQSAGGMTIGLTPDSTRGAGNAFLDVELPTGLGEMRNELVVRSADAVIAVGGSWGTLSEVALALRAGKSVVSLDGWRLSEGAGTGDERGGGLQLASSAEDAVVRAFAALARTR